MIITIMYYDTESLKYLLLLYSGPIGIKQDMR